MSEEEEIDLSYYPATGVDGAHEDAYGGGEDVIPSGDPKNRMLFMLLASLIVAALFIGLMTLMINHGTFDGTPIKDGYDWFVSLGS